MRRNNRAGSIAFHLFSIALGFVMIYPLLWMLASSLKSNSEIFVNSYSLIPKQFDAIRNYVSGWEGIAGQNFGKFIMNSFIVTIPSTVIGVFCSLLAAYAFARLKFTCKKFLFGCVMVTLMIPSQVMVVPQYIIFRRLELHNTYFSMMAPWIFGHAFFIFLMTQFFRGLPKELDEAAEIDGCGKLGILFRIHLPLVSPAVITSAIFSFYWVWQDFFQPLIFISDPKKFTVPLALNMFTDPNSYSNYGGMFAMSVISLLPVLAIFVFFQKYLIEGIATTGMKG